MKKGEEHALIIGGGVIGLSCAWFLSREGYRVTIVDRDSSGKESCSDGNAGMVVPSHFIPLAAPGVVSQGLKWMLNRRSPFYLRPRIDLKLWAWCWQFLRHSNRQHVENSQTLLRDLSLESRALFSELSEELGFSLVERGLLMLCQSEKGLREEIEVAEAANRLGIDAEVCGPERLCELEEGVKMNAAGGVWFPRDAHLDPVQFLEALRRGIKTNGGAFQSGEVVECKRNGTKIQRVILANGSEIDADKVIICGGAWSPAIADKLELRIPMQGGKGYSMTLTNPRKKPSLCSLLKEGRVAVTPMGEKLRVAGTMEICGDDLSVDTVRVQGIVRCFTRFFPEFNQSDFEDLEVWSGLRPCSPDGLPYIGNIPGIDNAFLATGHSMLGLSLGPITGRTIASLVQGSPSEPALRVDRFS